MDLSALPARLQHVSRVHAVHRWMLSSIVIPFGAFFHPEWPTPNVHGGKSSGLSAHRVANACCVFGWLVGRADPFATVSACVQW